MRAKRLGRSLIIGTIAVVIYVAIAIAAVCVLGTVGLIVGRVASSKREGAAEETLRARAEAQAATIEAISARKEIDDAVNADSDLLARARRVMHHASAK